MASVNKNATYEEQKICWRFVKRHDQSFFFKQCETVYGNRYLWMLPTNSWTRSRRLLAYNKTALHVSFQIKSFSFWNGNSIDIRCQEEKTLIWIWGSWLNSPWLNLLKLLENTSVCQKILDHWRIQGRA